LPLPVSLVRTFPKGLQIKGSESVPKPIPKS